MTFDALPIGALFLYKSKLRNWTCEGIKSGPNTYVVYQAPTYDDVLEFSWMGDHYCVLDWIEQDATPWPEATLECSRVTCPDVLWGHGVGCSYYKE